jgi:hypothetical protein
MAFKGDRNFFKKIAEQAASALGQGGGFSGGSGKTFTLSKEYEPAQMKKGGMVSSASKRADGCAVKGKTKGRFV